MIIYQRYHLTSYFCCYNCYYYYSKKITDGSDVELAGHALNLFVDGFETSSQVMAFGLYELAKNPHIQEQVHREIVEVLAKHDNKLTYESLQDMPYLDNVVYGRLTNFSIYNYAKTIHLQ